MPIGKHCCWEEGEYHMDKERLAFLKEDYVQGFPAAVGFEVVRADYGRFESRLKFRPEHTQQDGFVHAGVIATMADHTAGYAAFTTVPETHRILTVEFKINFFKPATGESIVCRSRVVNNGKTIKVSESEIFSLTGDQEKLVAKAMVTLMAVPSSKIDLK
jgi:uncharacterized protein (TIGR00369 family)